MVSRQVLEQLVFSCGSSFSFMGYVNVNNAREFAERLRQAEKYVAQFVVLDDGHINTNIPPQTYSEAGIIKFPIPNYRDEHRTAVQIGIPSMLQQSSQFRISITVMGNDLPIYHVADNIHERIMNFLRPYHALGNVYP